MWVANLKNRHPVSLRQLLPSASFVGCADIAVTSVSEQSQNCTDGCLFAAIAGSRADGNLFIQEAIARGARALLCERPHPGVPIPQCVVPHTRAAYAKLCQALFGMPSRRMKTVGVTGTNGKTTTTYLVRSILRAADYQTGLLGTIEYHDGISSEQSQLTTPDPPALAQWLNRMAENQTTHAVFELSSHAMHQGRSEGVALDVAIVTNITQDHLDYHQSFEAYQESKSRIVRHLKPDGAIVLNRDNRNAWSLTSKIPDWQNVISYGLSELADVRASGIEQSLMGSRFLLHLGKETIPVKTHLIGQHNIENCLAAAAATYQLEIQPENIAQGIERLVSVPGRLEAVDLGQDYRVFVDYAHTDDALRRCVQSLKPLTKNRLICVFGAGGDRDRTKRPLFATATRDADMVILTSDNPRSEDPNQIIEDILAGYQDVKADVRIEPNREHSLMLALEQAEPGDTILVAGKGHETYQIIGEKRYDFDDREVIQRLLAKTLIRISA